MEFNRLTEVPASERFSKAKEKAESIISEIDLDLTVSIREVTIHATEADEHQATVLRFDHAQNPDMRWAMEIELSDKYLENELEDAIKRAYRTRAWKSKDPKYSKIAGKLLE